MDILSASALTNTEDTINTTALFGGVQRTILSKDFKGGKIKNMFSSTELDFTQADVNGVAILEISQAFGEITLAVPPDWRVEADLDHICSTVDEGRSPNRRSHNSEKVLLLKGLSMFAVVDVVSSF